MIGNFRSRIGIYRPVVADDDMGGQVTTWPFFDAMWAQIVSLAPVESFENGRHSISLRYKITLRYRPDFPERARLLWKEKTLRVIAHSDPDARGERLHLICEEELQ